MDFKRLGVEHLAIAPPVAVEFGSGRAIVVLGNPMPSGPTLMVFPSITVVVGWESVPIVRVVPEMTASEGPMEKVRSAAVIGVRVSFVCRSRPESEYAFDPAVGMGMVVLGPITSDSLIVNVCPFTTREVADGRTGKSVICWVPILTVDGPTAMEILESMMGSMEPP